jgi:hypothetical protein
MYYDSRGIHRRVEAVMRAAAAEEGIQFAESAPIPEEALWLNEDGFVGALDSIFGEICKLMVFPFITNV